ncbi:GTPase, G3E family [Halopseudomonas xinjiangensis]|uniref:GTPase, G3E family n=1 Tax=Halopseudomonas xinjiangensis TaxID=487184 RepID=A0A1H1XSV4_9GAMM|nr:GTP-binding protein [Halopseudomonas xinjiangensis]SDT11836.1 GTPase, G3E family [Halopseudomonas xinjiangensis]
MSTICVRFASLRSTWNPLHPAAMTNSMLRHIPTHLIAGPLGAGKTSLLRALLAQRPAGERWAVLVNEFGQVGLDAALLDNGHEPDLTISEIPGGCLCCINGLPFQVGLGRLLRRARPDRLFVETSGLGHPRPLLRQLSEPPWDTVLQLHPLVMVLDAAALAAGTKLAPSQADALELAGMLVMNKAETVSDPARERITETLPDVETIWCSNGEVHLASLPSQQESEPPREYAEADLPTGAAPPARLWRSTQDWQRHEQSFEQGTGTAFSLGWIVHPSVCFNRCAIEQWLAAARWLRAKGAIRTEQGWQRFNALQGGEVAWSFGTARSDNRIELILSQRADAGALEAALRKTVRAS